MRKILFYYDNFCGEHSRGGTEVATFRIARALKETGQCEVYNAFRNKSSEKGSSIFNDSVKLSHNSSRFVSRLGEFIRNKEIDAVVNMGRFFRHDLIMKAVRRSGRDVKVIFMLHFAPGSEKKKSTFRSGFHLLRLNPFNPLYWLRASFYPLFKLPRILRLAPAYRKVYNNSDKVVLLSESYIPEYAEFASLTETGKLKGIPNIYENRDNREVCVKKEKRVLILSRMDEIQKRISLALKIWKEIEQDNELQDWHLDIVGDGHDISIFKRLCSGLNLKNVTFHGWQAPEKFLERSSVLMMTSEYEGLPLSLLEARANGCVPVAYNSYGSLGDVISDGENGMIVEGFNDIGGYVDKLKSLMKDEKKRDAMARKGKGEFDRFSSVSVATEWLRLLDDREN